MLFNATVYLCNITSGQMCYLTLIFFQNKPHGIEYCLPLFLHGDSASGGLAYATVRSLNNHVRGTILFEPCIDPMTSSSFITHANGPFWTRRANLHAWAATVGNGVAPPQNQLNYSAACRFRSSGTINSGISRSTKRSKYGTVNSAYPCPGVYSKPILISSERVGPRLNCAPSRPQLHLLFAGLAPTLPWSANMLLVTR